MPFPSLLRPRRYWILCVLLLSGCATTRPVDAPPPLILISIDGLHPDTLARVAPPTLSRWQREGTHARWMQPAYPTLTFPNHYTLVTGLEPDRHGVVHNRMVDADLGPFRLSLRAAVSDGRWYEAEPLWATAQRHDLRSATLFWPGSEARIAGVRPDDWLPYAGDMPANERVDRVLRWLDRDRPRRPHLITLYFADVDEAGHTHGPDAPAVDASLRHVDAALARLDRGLARRGLRDAVHLIVVSDHGMAAVDTARPRRLDAGIALHDDEVVSSGEVIGVAPRAGREAAVASALLGRHDGFECWRRESLPTRWRYGRHSRVPPIVCQADEGVHVTHAARAAAGGAISRGAHGYAPEAASMRAVFIARGPWVRRGLTLAPIRAVDVHPLLLRLLSLPDMASDGDAAATAAGWAQPAGG